MHQHIINGFGIIAGRWPLEIDKSTLIFIHGAGGSKKFWAAQVDGLYGRVNTVAIDLPGHGSSTGEGRRTVAEYADVVAEFIVSIDVPNPVLCGLSMGGAITQQLLLDHPAGFCAGILISTGAKLKVAQAIFETIEKDYAAFVDMLNQFGRSAKSDADIVQIFVEDLQNCKPEVTYGDFQACNEFNAVDRLSEIKLPVLVITAEDDQLTPAKYGQFLEEHVQNARRVHIADAGHVVPLEKASEVNAAIRNFLDENQL